VTDDYVHPENCRNEAERDEEKGQLRELRYRLGLCNGSLAFEDAERRHQRLKGCLDSAAGSLELRVDLSNTPQHHLGRCVVEPPVYQLSALSLPSVLLLKGFHHVRDRTSEMGECVAPSAEVVPPLWHRRP